MKYFDLNIGKILESWDVHHAIREIIANALDEQVLSNSDEIQIYHENGTWHIRDFGRGLNYHHLTQNENEEKLKNDALIGRFGVGLKDALATLYRKQIDVTISSKYGVFTLDKISKDGFDDLLTLHAKIVENLDTNMQGTDFAIKGCSENDINTAKSLFLKYTNENILEKTELGDVISKEGTFANIYINGIKVAEEPNFLFSYNITSLTKQLRKALNRERTNVGRSAYSDRVKAILTNCMSEAVLEPLCDDFMELGSGLMHDELTWNDVALHVSSKLSKIDDEVSFVTTDDLENNPDIIDDMKEQGLNPVVITGALAEKMEKFNNKNADDDKLQTTRYFIEKQKERLEFDFVEGDELTSQEKAVYEKTEQILSLIGGMPENVKDILISNTLYNEEGYVETLGLWQPAYQRIIIKRKQLYDLEKYAGTLLHECAHASSGEGDVSRAFERELTGMLGCIAKELISIKDTNGYTKERVTKDNVLEIITIIKNIQEKFYEEFSLSLDALMHELKKETFDARIFEKAAYNYGRKRLEFSQLYLGYTDKIAPVLNELAVAKEEDSGLLHVEFAMLRNNLNMYFKELEHLYNELVDDDEEWLVELATIHPEDNINRHVLVASKKKLFDALKKGMDVYNKAVETFDKVDCNLKFRRFCTKWLSVFFNPNLEVGSAYLGELYVEAESLVGNSNPLWQEYHERVFPNLNYWNEKESFFRVINRIDDKVTLISVFVHKWRMTANVFDEEQTEWFVMLLKRLLNLTFVLSED